MIDVALLSELSFAKGLPPRALESLATMAGLQTVAGGEVLFREGALCQDLYLVQTGLFTLDSQISAEGRVTILEVGPGELLAWSALLGEGSMTATATAIEESRIIVLPGDKLRTLCHVDHDFGYSLMRHLAIALSKRLLATRLHLLGSFAPTDHNKGGASR
ncbi:MAG: Crp/Fnr family transcriptional regulator [Planctomycetia bacterium]|nr:Crp/Fnr family transcriptional regulator [Planctomycetia bacterium]